MLEKKAALTLEEIRPLDNYDEVSSLHWPYFKVIALFFKILYMNKCSLYSLFSFNIILCKIFFFIDRIALELLTRHVHTSLPINEQIPYVW